MTAGDVTLRDVDIKRCLECGAPFGRDAAFCPFDGAPLSAGTWDPTGDPLVGTVLDGRYEVRDPLGTGGMGSVYRVRHLMLDRMFAMKILRRDLASDRALAARFEREARATAAVKHPGVIAITDFGRLEDATPYFVMELLEGETLAARIRKDGAMPPTSVIALATKICAALQASHDAGVIHRDLKPENVFLVGDATSGSSKEVRVVDFGAAKIVGGSKLTRPGVVFGTPHYMSPEQASGQALDGRADIYSLGVLMYEMLTGAVPFSADTYMGVLTQHLFASPPAPSERVSPGVQLGELEAIVLRALDKSPAMRFRSMRELGDALQAARPGVSPSAPPPLAPGEVPSAVAPGAGASGRLEASIERRVLAHDRERRRRVVVVAVITAPLAALAGLVGLELLARDDTAPPEASASAGTASAGAGAASARPASAGAPAEPPLPVDSASARGSTVAAPDESAASRAGPPVASPYREVARGSRSGMSPSALPAAAVAARASTAVASSSAAPAGARTAAPPKPSVPSSTRRERNPDDLPDPWAR